MADYKELYFHLFSATEQAINILIAAQRECEEKLISTPETRLIVLPKGGEELPGESRPAFVSSFTKTVEKTGETVENS